MTGLIRDFRFALRSFQSSLTVTAIMILALALGIGVNASCFTMLNAMVLNPLPFPRLDRLVTLWDSPENLHSVRGSVSPADYLDWRERSRSFEGLAAFHGWDANLSGGNEPERLLGCRVSPGFFEVLGMLPQAGRTFRRQEEQRGLDRVAVVSYGFQKRRRAGSGSVVGSTVVLDGEAYTIVGVMPERFNFPLETEVWAPLAPTPAERQDRSSRSLAVLGRLRPEVTLAQARAEMAAIADRIAAEHPGTNERRGASVVPILELTNQVTDRFVTMMQTTAGFVLLLACANVGNLFLVALAGRSREVAVRSALGASRFHLSRQLGAECVLLALAAAGIGLGLAVWNTSITQASVPATVFRYATGLRDAKVDGVVVGWTLGLSVLAGLLCAAPAVVHVLRGAAGAELLESLKEGGRSATAGRGHQRLRSMLAVTEIVLALVLMVGAGVMVRTLQRLLTANPGYRTEQLLSFGLSPAGNQYPNDGAVAGFYDRVLREIAAIPSARSAGLSSGAGGAGLLHVEGRPEPRPGEPMPGVSAVTPGYFRALELPTLRGRAIGDQDGRDAQPVVVLSEFVARHYFPGSDPLGARVRLGNDPRWLTVVGIAGDVRDWFEARPQPAAYMPFAQRPSLAAQVFVRTAGDPWALQGAVRAAVRNVDRALPVFDLKPIEQLVYEQTSGVRTAAWMMSLYAGIALLLAASGVYAIISYSVSQRTHEIGIRLVVGAAPEGLQRMIFTEGLRVGAIGLGIGIPAALALMQLMSSALYGVVRLDWFTLAGAAAVLAGAAAVAGWVPAWRASRTDPVEALRRQ